MARVTLAPPTRSYRIFAVFREFLHFVGVCVPIARCWANYLIILLWNCLRHGDDRYSELNKHLKEKHNCLFDITCIPKINTCIDFWVSLQFEK